MPDRVSATPPKRPTRNQYPVGQRVSFDEVLRQNPTTPAMAAPTELSWEGDSIPASPKNATAFFIPEPPAWRM